VHRHVHRRRDGLSVLERPQRVIAQADASLETFSRARYLTV
jgi:hypothetical protein